MMKLAAIMAASVLGATLTASSAAAQDVSPSGQLIKPFQFQASDDALSDLKRRIAATRWPTRELVADDTQGVRLGTMQKLADYWVNG